MSDAPKTPAAVGGLDLDPAARARADELAARVEHHRAKYYAGSPEISDAAFDAIEDELRAIDPTHPVLAKVGAAPAVTEWEKARHEIPMGSLNKVVNEQELRDWIDRCEELLAKESHEPIRGELFVAEKLDGLSLEVIYRDGKLAEAITRGDGEVGERITANVARMRGVPHRIREARPISVRGEIILRRSTLENEPFFAEYSTTRNGAAGVSRRFDGKGSEHLTVLFYDVADHVDFPTEQAKFAWLRGLGLATPRTAAGTLDDVLALYARYQAETRETLDYEIDGLVVSVDSLAAQAILGELNRRPRGATAFKFASPSKVTRVERIEWDTGPSGRVTPVAHVAPVELVGATVQRASLHNVGHVRALGIAVGDEVLVSRRNDVIPYVEEVVARRGTAEEPPTICPRCAQGIAMEGEYLVCRNALCPALVEGRIHNWIEAIGALEWGDKLVAEVVATGLVREPADLYRLSVDDLAKLEKGGEKAVKLGKKVAEKCLAELTSRLPVTLPVFLAGLGIEGFAIQTARLLFAAGYTTLDEVLAATEAELAEVNGLGEIKARNIVKGLGARREEIGRLLAAGIVPVTPEQAGPLAGLTFCFTGAAERPRAELVRIVEGAGGRVLSSVTKELRFLVIADVTSTSTKAAKARKLGTQLITEDDLVAMANGAPPPPAPAAT
jgi:DNA ligase (NAD+)